MSQQTVSTAKQKMSQSLEAFERDLATVRTGRANPSLVENLVVDAYDSKMRLQELASITAPEPALIIIQPWDGSVTGAISNAISQSELNINPVVEGTVIRLPIPPLTQERRQDLVKMVGKKAEDARISIRSIRQDALAGLKRSKEANEISEDEQGGFEKQIQSAVEDHNATIDRLAKTKEQDLLAI